MEYSSLTHFPLEQQSDNVFIFKTACKTYKLSVYTEYLNNYPAPIHEVSFWPEINGDIKFEKFVDETIVFFIYELLKSVEGACVSYVCDNTDKRELARKRLFSKWYNYFGDNCIKLDSEINSLDGKTYHQSIITLKTNPFFNQLKSEYFSAITEYNGLK